MQPWSSPSSTDPVTAARRTSRRAVATTAACLVVAALAAGCSDDAQCGPGAAPADGLTVTIAGETVTYGGFTASINNDCTVAGSGVISVSVHGTQVGGTGTLTLCLPRPDLLGGEPVALAPTRLPPDPGDRVQLIDASATLAAGCSVVRSSSSAPSATATFTGYCAGGTDPAGYALGWTGTIGLRRTCPAGMDDVAGTVGGAVAVAVD